MPESPYEVLALFAGAMVAASIFVVGTGTVTPFLKTAFNLGQTQLGMVLSVELMGSLVATAVAGGLTDRFGDKRVVLWSGWLMGIALICASLVRDFHWILGWLLLYGVGYAAVTPAGSHAIVFFFKKEARGFAMGVRQCGVPLAGVIASLLLPAIAIHYGYQWSIAVAGIVTIAACTAASMLYREPEELHGERISFRAMLVDMLRVAGDARLILLTLTSMTLVSAQMAMFGFLALTFAHQAGFSIGIAVLVFTISQVAAMAGRISWGWASDKIFHGSRSLPLVVVCAMAAVCVFGVSLVSPHTTLWEAGALAAVLGFSAEGWFGVAVIGIAEIGGEEHSGSALGVSLTFIFFAAFAAPTVFGAIAQAFGYDFAWRSLAILVATGIVPALLSSAVVRRLAVRPREAA
ncbi:MAG TPA: MFS transporter [Candidatus Tumulicola sp.]|jgi:MFS family permease